MPKPRLLPSRAGTWKASICLSKLVKYRLSEIETYRAAAEAGRVEGVHDLRVSCRRLQAVLRAFRSQFPNKRTKKIRRRLRGLIVALGAVREFDVLIGHILGSVKARSVEQKTALSLLVGRCSLGREQAFRGLVAALRRMDEHAWPDDLRAVASQIRETPRADAVTFASLLQEAIPGCFADFMGASERVVGHPSARAALHRLRIRGKPLRYVMEFSQNLFGPEYRRRYQEVKTMIELLGDIHDIDVTLNSLNAYLAEIRMANVPAEAPVSVTIQTNFLRSAVAALWTARAEKFLAMSDSLTAWKKQRFGELIGRGMGIKPGR